MGTPEFGAIILERLIKNGYQPVLAITASDKPVGRKQIITPPPVKLLAKQHKINIIQPEQILNSKLEIKNLKPDLIVVAAYRQILPKEILEIPKYGCLNVHPSLLPKYRGPSPVQHAILNGDGKTGVTIMLMDEKMDHGSILAQRTLEIEKKETGETLHDKLANQGANLLMETIPKWIRKEIKAKTQNDSKATYTRIIKKENGKINWQKPAEDIERQIRAFNPWPGSYTFWEKNQIKILKARIFKFKDTPPYPIGKTLVVPQNELAVQCKKDFLAIERLQMEGKKPMGSEEFLRGHSDFIGTILK